MNTSSCYYCQEPVSKDERWCPACGQLLGASDTTAVTGEQINLDHRDYDDVDTFMRAYVASIELRGANLRGIDLFNAHLVGADLRGANLAEANLSGANLSGADLRGATLYGADLSQTKLNGTNLNNAILTDTDLQWATYDHLTRWPADFFPELLGAINIANK